MKLASSVRRAVALVAFLGVACTSGPLKVRETHYFAVPNGEDTNYYRLRVRADTQLGVASYREGWFPATAVDSLFGDVSAESGGEDIEARKAIRQAYREKIVATTRNWLEEAAKPDASEEELERLLEARKRVLAYPRVAGDPYPGALEVEYNPARGVVTLHADEKMVFVLSSNPDEVVGKIANFAESEKTVYSVNQLAKVVSQRARNEVAADGARDEVRRRYDQLAVEQMKSALATLEAQAEDLPDEATAKPARAELLQEIDVLLRLIETLEASR